MAINDEIVKLILDIQKSGGTDNAIKTLDNLKSKLEETDTAAKKASGGVAGMGQSLLQSGRVIQDFAQGGLGGILNNIEGLTMALGLGAGLAGVLTVVGVAALVAGPQVKSFFKGLIDGVNEIPKSKDGVEGLTQTIKDNGEALDALRKQQSLTNTELKEFNRLTTEQVDLEKKLKVAKKEAADEAKLAGLKPAGQEEAEKERAAILQGEFGGDQDALADAINQQIVSQHKQAQRTFENLPEGDPRRIEAGQRADRLFRLRMRPNAGRDIARNAIVGGKEADINEALKFLPRLEGLPGQKFRAGFERALRGDEPDEEEKEFERQLEERREAVRRRNANAKKKRDANKRIDDLNKQGQEGAEIAFDQMDRNRAEGIRDARKAAEEAKKLRDADQLKNIDLQKLKPLLDPNRARTPEELNEILLQNQMIIAENEMIAAKQALQARQIQVQLRQVPNVFAGQQ